MSISERDRHIIKTVYDHCLKIEMTTARFGRNFQVFADDPDFQDSACMNILQIGELVGGLSQDYTDEYPEIDWRGIRGMRNIFAHNYGSMDPERTWDTITVDIPRLKAHCLSVMPELSSVGE